MKTSLKPIEVGGHNYEIVGASAAAQVLGTAGALSDFLARLIVTVNTAATSTVAILDGTTSIAIMPANTPIGVYSIELGLQAVTGPWKVTTGAGVTVLAVGQFSI